MTELTPKDFHYSKFRDANGYECSIEVSYACRKYAEHMIWFSKDTERMHLTQ